MSYTSPLIGKDGTIYNVSSDSSIVACSGSGNYKWRYRHGASVFSSPALGSDESFFFITYNPCILYSLSSSGTLNWKTEFDGYNGYSSLTIDNSGTLYAIVSTKLYAIESGCTGLSDGPWPMLYRNARHTSSMQDN